MNETAGPKSVLGMCLMNDGEETRKVRGQRETHGRKAETGKWR